MDETRHFGLPLLAAGQAQKHVTVNEALARIDALAVGVVESASQPTPPVAADGDVYVVPLGGAPAWGIAETAFAVFLNGGWVGVAPVEGRVVWVRDEGRERRFSSGAWVPVEAPAGPEPSGPALEAITLDVPLVGGTRFETAPIISGGSIVFGLTARVIDAVKGAEGWRIGVPEADSRYGVGHATTVGATAIGLTGAPLGYAEPTPLIITAESGSFSGGLVRVSVHCTRLTPPEAA